MTHGPLFKNIVLLLSGVLAVNAWAVELVSPRVAA
jgi:hypothetical protein